MISSRFEARVTWHLCPTFNVHILRKLSCWVDVTVCVFGVTFEGFGVTFEPSRGHIHCLHLSACSHCVMLFQGCLL